jgi:hypothetical protein
MAEFEKDCPICKQRFTSLLEYTTHLSKDHSDIPIEKILNMNKEEKWSIFGR